MDTVCTFLASPRKVPKEGDIGEALRKCALPYVPHPPHRQPAFKNVPIFERLQVRNLKISLCSAPKIGTFSGYGWRCGGGFQRGRIFVAPLWSPSFGTFLGEARKVHYYQRQLFIFAVISRILFCILASPFFNATSTFRMA